MELVKQDFEFLSSNKVNTIKGFKISPEQGEVKICLMISHGMVEYAQRYENFMEFLAQNGVAVYAHDHLGHKNSVNNDEELGYFAPKDGYKCILDDLAYVAKMSKSENPGKKLIILGHSMGSFYARVFCGWYKNLADGLIISGTGGSNKLANIGKNIVKSLILVKGDKYRSKFVTDLTFKDFLSKIDNPRTPSDWLTKDETVVDKYVVDKYCQFKFTLSAYNDLMDINTLSNRTKCFVNTDNKLPIFMFSGTMDPVGSYGIGVMEVFEKYKSNGIEDISIRLYDTGRHEMLNELNKDQVYQDVLHWLEKQI